MCLLVGNKGIQIVGNDSEKVANSNFFSVVVVGAKDHNICSAGIADRIVLFTVQDGQ